MKQERVMRLCVRSAVRHVARTVSGRNWAKVSGTECAATSILAPASPSPITERCFSSRRTWIPIKGLHLLSKFDLAVHQPKGNEQYQRNQHKNLVVQRITSV